MVELAYALSSEEHDARTLVATAQRAEEAGFRSVWISDHYHPWIDRQGQSPFVWSVIGGIAATTELTVTTAVTCPGADPPGGHRPGHGDVQQHVAGRAVPVRGRHR
jgi:alkanesulfonate monooxygenase SsuD/methylene tetrahydromethanopterin reductase-like flavin-dependent oxidoreductase (luciferase family)